MVRHHDMSALANKQLGHADSLRLQILKLFDQNRWVDDHTIANHIYGASIKNARWNDMELEGAALIDDGMAGVVAATITDHQARALSQQIDDMALAFVAPLGANYRDDWHSCFPSE